MITLQNLTVTLGNCPLLTDITLSCRAGQITSIIGPNGAGKSSLVKTIAGLQPYASGSLHLSGVDSHELSLQKRAKMLAYMPQGTQVHWPLTVRHLVALGRYPRGLPNQKAAIAAVDAVLDQVGIASLKDRAVTQLSGGERALVLLARALMVGADILLLDEPTASLDPRFQLQVMALLQQQAEAGKTVVTVLHDLSLAERFSDQMVLINKGAILAAGAPNSVLTDDNLAQAYGIRRGEAGFVSIDSV